MLNNRKSQEGCEQQARDRRLHFLSLVEVSFFVRVVLLYPSLSKTSFVRTSRSQASRVFQYITLKG